MQKSSRMFWSCLAGVVALVCVGNVNAASRSMMDNPSRAGGNVARMPTMPTMSINTIGTHAVGNVVTNGTTNNNGGGNNGGGNNGGGTGSGGYTDPVNPSGCRDSEYTVNMCMESLTRCVQANVQGGVNAMFNEDVRNSIFGGMGVCATEVDKCINDVTVNCNKVYTSFLDVWLDFNSRVIQPEYYNFVLRKTGLTPNQAKNVCELLDKNTYGKSFAAVSGNDNVTSEYAERVGAYNEQRDGSLSKANPLGATVNTVENGNVNGVDGKRGHYARWDAAEGVCKIRVAAYNKDNLITNKWLFGALGDDRAAEVWQDAGSTFTCNKDLFDFSLLKNTNTTALVGMGGGTALGAGIGALAGHGDKTFDCDDDAMREKLFKQIRDNKLEIKLSKYMSTNVGLQASAGLNEEQCEQIVALYDDYVNLTNALELCADEINVAQCTATNGSGSYPLVCENRVPKFEGSGAPNLSSDSASGTWKLDDQTVSNTELIKCINLCVNTGGLEQNKVCKFKEIAKTEKLQEGYVCGGSIPDCNPRNIANKQKSELKTIFAKLDLLQGEKSNRLQTTLTGAGIGLGTGAVATAITAFVERNNISCRVGDGLNTVGFGKSFTIGSLKDYYVKWNLRVADSVLPTAVVNSCQQWIDTCAMYAADKCNDVELNYQPVGRNSTSRVHNACRWDATAGTSGNGACLLNGPVAVTYGACVRVSDDTDGLARWLSPNDPYLLEH